MLIARWELDGLVLEIRRYDDGTLTVCLTTAPIVV